MISVIIPVYNKEPYLRRCVDSVLNQTYHDLEIILVDDGSTDNCGHICDWYASIDGRVRVIHQLNKGVSAARNAGLECASGDYIAFLDSDDYIDSTMYERLLDIMMLHEADIAECGYRWVKPDVIYDRENTGEVATYTNIEALEKLYFGDQMFGGISIVVWNKLYRKELLSDLRFAEGYNFEDIEFTPRALFNAQKIVKLNLNLLNFYFSENSISRSDYSIKKTDSIEMKRRIMDYFEQNNIERYYLLSQSSYIGNLLHHYYECNLRKNDIVYSDKAKYIKEELKRILPTVNDNTFCDAERWKYRIFMFSPSVFFHIMRVGKILKEYLVRLKK